MSGLTNAAFAEFLNEIVQVASRTAGNTLHAVAAAGAPATGIVPLRKVEECTGQIQAHLNRMLTTAAAKDRSR